MPLYGNEKAGIFENLLKDHLIIAADLVKAAKAGDDKQAEKLESQWYANADDIAKFLAGINPYWSEDEWKMMLHRHLALVKSEAVNSLQRNYEEDIKVYDEIENQSLNMADVMSEGIIRQFPYLFKS